MKNKLLFKLLSGVSFVFSLFLFPNHVLAQQNSSLLPDEIKNIFGLMGEQGGGTAKFITGRVRMGLVIALGLLVLVAVVYAMIAAFKYIQSQGDSQKIEEAQKAIKAIFMGVAAMMIGIVGIVLVFVFFAASQPAVELNQVCLSAPNSAGCAACSTGDALCQTCNEEYASGKVGAALSPDCRE